MLEDENNETHRGLEKREFIRFPFTFPIKHRVLEAGESSAEYVESQSDNISLGGIMFFSGVGYDMGQDLDLVIQYSAGVDMEPFAVQANVRWIQTTNSNPPEFLIGVQFIHLSAENEELINKLVDECVEFQTKMNS